ncbi:MAG: hypothetical protein NT007_01585 [Candidatus Kapabacteria bacterium]|nr:hypothetical protein [Candidatus Kapabacteria bacterium]
MAAPVETYDKESFIYCFGLGLALTGDNNNKLPRMINTLTSTIDRFDNFNFGPLIDCSIGISHKSNQNHSLTFNLGVAQILNIEKDFLIYDDYLINKYMNGNLLGLYSLKNSLEAHSSAFLLEAIYSYKFDISDNFNLGFTFGPGLNFISNVWNENLTILRTNLSDVKFNKELKPLRFEDHYTKAILNEGSFPGINNFQYYLKFGLESNVLEIVNPKNRITKLILYFNYCQPLTKMKDQDKWTSNYFSIGYHLMIGMFKK